MSLVIEQEVKRLNRRLDPEVKSRVFAYLDSPIGERIPQKEFIQNNGLIRPVFYSIKQLHGLERKMELEDVKAQVRDIAEKKQLVNGVWENLEAQERTEGEEWDVFMGHLLKQAMKENAPAAVMDLFATLKGKKVVKSEVKIGISADELARRNLIAEQELREAGH